MNYLNWRERGGLGKIRRAKVAYYILTNNYFEIQLSAIPADCFSLQLIIFLVLQVFIQYRESNAIHIETL